MRGKIGGNTEHIINRKPRINGVVTTDMCLTPHKNFSNPKIRKKITNIFEVVRTTINRENADIASDNTISFSNTAKVFTVTITKGGATEDFNIGMANICKAKMVILRNRMRNAIRTINGL